MGHCIIRHPSTVRRVGCVPEGARIAVHVLSETLTFAIGDGDTPFRLFYRITMNTHGVHELRPIHARR